MMKSNIAFPIILLLVSLFSFSNMRASHLAGGEITYETLGPGQYQVSLTLYRDCSGIPTLTDYLLEAYSPSCDSTILFPVFQTGQPSIITLPCNNALTTCAGGTVPGIEKYVYSGFANLPAFCSDWEFSFSECCRNGAITTLQTPFGEEMHLTSSHTNNFLGIMANTSVTFSNDPILFLCANQPVFYNHGAVDLDGDSLVYSLVNPLSEANVPVVFSAGFSATQPLSSSTPITLDPATGALNFTPSAAGEVGVISILVEEYRGGILVGSVVRDLQVWVISCQNQVPMASGFNGSNDFTLDVCPGQSVCFDIITSDSDSGQTTTFDWTPIMPTMTTSSVGNVHTVCWIPSTADVGTHVFTGMVSDDACPMNASQVYTYVITVGGGGTVTQDTTTCVGDTLLLEAMGGLNYIWELNGMVVSTTDQYWHVPNIAGTDVFTVTIMNGTNCSSIHDIVVDAVDCTNPCDNAIDGGTIGYDESSCVPFDPANIIELAPVTGGTGVIEYLWLSSTDGISFTPIPGATGPTYDPPFISQTMYYRRCARRAGCTIYIAESNDIIKEVGNCSSPCDTLGIDAGFLFSAVSLDASFTDASSGMYSLVEWDFGDGTMVPALPGETVDHTYAQSGTYVVCIKAIGWLGNLCCHDLFCDTITVVQDTCDYYSTAFTYQYIGSGRYEFVDGTTPSSTYSIWDFGDGSAAVTNGAGSTIEHTFTPGTYNVCMTSVSEIDDSICCVNEVCMSLVVQPYIRSSVIGSISFQPDINFGSLSGMLKVQVNDPVKDIQPVFAPLTDELNMNVRTAVTQYGLTENIFDALAQTNQAQRHYWTAWEAGESVELEVYSMNGQLIQSETVEGTGFFELRLSNVPAGVYILKAKSENVVESHKFIKF